MTTTTRTAYVASTPDRVTFVPSQIESLPYDRATSTATFIPAPPLLAQHRRGGADVWKRARATVKNNTGMLLIAASQVRTRVHFRVLVCSFLVDGICPR